MSDSKPQFDPTQPYEPVGESEAVAKPAFDPGKPYEPVSTTGEKAQAFAQGVDKYTGGTGTRAAVSAYLEGKGLSGAKDAFIGQYGANPPAAPSGHDQMVKYGVPDEKNRFGFSRADAMGALADLVESPLMLLGPLARGAGAVAESVGPLVKIAQGVAESKALGKTAAVVGGLGGFAKGGLEGAYVGAKALPETIKKGLPIAGKVSDVALKGLGQIGNSAAASKAGELSNFLRTPSGQAVLRRIQGNQ